MNHMFDSNTYRSRRETTPLQILTLRLTLLVSIFICGCGGGTKVFSVAPKAPDCSPVNSSGQAGSVVCTADGLQAFATTVEECGISDKFTTRATTRQLLVGLTDIKFLSQDAATYGDNRGLLSIISAKYDIDPINLVVFSSRTDNCVKDTIVWKQASLEAEENKDLSSGLETLLKSIILNSSVDLKGIQHVGG